MIPDESRNRAVDRPSVHGDGRNGPGPYSGRGTGTPGRHSGSQAAGRVPLADHPALEWLAVHLWQLAQEAPPEELHAALAGWLADRQATGLAELTQRDVLDE